ncbi:MAG: hypothetical protein ACXADB_11845 [Candidatus Hermodarchaeia archaeon]|jgi:hypothetical protein
MERLYEKYAWVIYLVLGLLWVVVGLTQAFYPDALLETDAQRVTDMSWSELRASSPEATELVRYHYWEMGLLKTSWSLFVLAVTLTGFRRGERWAWYTLWLVPICLISYAIFYAGWFGGVNESLESIPIITISLIGLILPYRKFFPRLPQEEESGNNTGR